MLSELLFKRDKSSSKYTVLPVNAAGQDCVSEACVIHPVNNPTINSLLPWKIAALGELFVILLLSLMLYNAQKLDDKPFSPLVQELITYHKVNFYSSAGMNRTPYQGRPSPEVDELWSDLLEGATFKITKDEERRLPNRTSAIPGDTDHYITTLSVFHHLHCLNRLRKGLWPEYYPEYDPRNATAFEHLEHCIDILRQAHMCNPDMTTAVWQWHTVDQESFPAWDVQHTCVDYRKIQKWALSRAVYEYDTKVYVEGNPTYQPVYHAL